MYWLHWSLTWIHTQHFLMLQALFLTFLFLISILYSRWRVKNWIKCINHVCFSTAKSSLICFTFEKKVVTSQVCLGVICLSCFVCVAEFGMHQTWYQQFEKKCRRRKLWPGMCRQGFKDLHSGLSYWRKKFPVALHRNTNKANNPKSWVKNKKYLFLSRLFL